MKNNEHCVVWGLFVVVFLIKPYVSVGKAYDNYRYIFHFIK